MHVVHAPLPAHVPSPPAPHRSPRVDDKGQPNAAIKSPVNVTTDVSCVAAADVVIVSLPAPAREAAVMEIGPHLKSQLVVFLPGSSGGMDLWLLRAALGDRAESCFASGLTYAASKVRMSSAGTRLEGSWQACVVRTTCRAAGGIAGGRLQQ